MKKRIGLLAAVSLLLGLLAASGAHVALAAVTIDSGACDVVHPGDPPSSFFEGGLAEGRIILRPNGTLQRFVCSGSVPDLGPFTGAHNGYTGGYFELTAGDTTSTQMTDCIVNTSGTTEATLICSPMS